MLNKKKKKFYFRNKYLRKKINLLQLQFRILNKIIYYLYYIEIMYLNKIKLRNKYFENLINFYYLE